MKKLLVAAMGIAAAYGAFADPFSVGKRFEGLTVDEVVTTNELNEVAGGTYWTDPVGATNTYTVKTMDAYGGSRPAFFPVAPDNALEVKTTFGQPLKFNFMGDGGSTKKEIGADGLYFDSLVKFTVCDSEPKDENAYSGAKIMMWLQSDEEETVTNVMIRAGYLTYNAGTVSSVATNYTCGTKDGNFADSWHRVTIKAIADITNGVEVPGFVVFIDGEMVIVPLSANYNVWGDGFPARSDNAKYWENRKALFPSIIQTADKKLFSAVEFDGTGSLNDVTVTETAPDFAKDQAAPKAEVKINGASVEEDVKTIEDAVGVINNVKYAGATAELTLLESVTLEAPIVFNGEGATTVTLDFAGFVLTNELDGAAITNCVVALTLTDSIGTGGIYCSDGIPAVYQSATSEDAISVEGGNFWGADPAIVLDENYTGTTKFISGGAFASDMGEDAEHLVDGKAFGEASAETDLYPVIDDVPPSEPEIDPSDPEPVQVEAETEQDAIDAVKIVTPSDVDEAEYKALFDITAVETAPGSGVFIVTVNGIKESVEETVEESAMDVLDEKLGAKVQVPAGLYYKITTYTELGGTAVQTLSDQSDGTGVEVSKPGTTQGFIQVEMATVPFN